jgi:hypothetical protein
VLQVFFLILFLEPGGLISHCIFCFCHFDLISGALCLLPVSLPRALNSERELLHVAAAAAATRVAGQALLACLAGLAGLESLAILPSLATLACLASLASQATLACLSGQTSLTAR